MVLVTLLIQMVLFTKVNQNKVKKLARDNLQNQLSSTKEAGIKIKNTGQEFSNLLQIIEIFSQLKKIIILNFKNYLSMRENGIMINQF